MARLSALLLVLLVAAPAPVDLGRGVCGDVSNWCDDAYVVKVQVAGPVSLLVCDPHGWRTATVPVSLIDAVALLDEDGHPTGERVLIE